MPTPTAAIPTEKPTLEPLKRIVQKAVDDGLVSGAVMLLARGDQILHQQVTGLADIDANRPAKLDDLYWIASITKPMTATLLMMLVDEGKVSVGDPVYKYLPEFEKLWVIQSQDENRMVLERPNRPLTIRDLLTHTGGLPNAPMPREGGSLADWVSTNPLMPLSFQPGLKWEYSNSGINAIGRIVEVISKQPYEQFLDQRLFQPLGMLDTTFHPKGEHLKRTVKSYKLDPETRKLSPVTLAHLNGPVGSTRLTVSPSGGLFSTASDTLRFYQFIANGGTWNGKRLLSEKSVKEMTRTQSGEIETGFVEGMSWGLGFAVVKAPQLRSSMFSKGTFGHGGAHGTHAWADPINGLIYILFMQRSNFEPHADGTDLRQHILTVARDAALKT